MPSPIQLFTGTEWPWNFQAVISEQGIETNEFPSYLNTRNFPNVGLQNTSEIQPQ